MVRTLIASMVLFVLIFVSCKSPAKKQETKKQQNVYAFECCLDSLLKNKRVLTNHEKGTAILQGNNIVLKFKSGDHVIPPERYKDWLVELDTFAIKAYKINNDSTFYYALSAPFMRPSGLATCINNWFVVNSSTGKTTAFQGISDKPESVFVDKATGKVNFVKFYFADSFFHRKKTPDNIEYDISIHSFDDGEIVDQFISRCQCPNE